MPSAGPEPSSPAPVAAVARTRSLEHLVLLCLTTLAALLLVVFALYVEPDPRGYGTHQKLGLPPCLPMELWELPCPGCGVTTSVALAARGEYLASFTNQPFGFLIALGIPLGFVVAWIVHLRGRDLRQELRRVPGWLAASLGVSIVGLSWLYKLALVRGWIG